jgi:MFS superfamily sulfate permease-like transporter
VLEAIAESPTRVRRIIITAEPVTSIDITSADMLAELEHTLTESGVELRFAEMKDPVKDKLKRFELFDRFGAADFYPTIGTAVDAYLEEHSVDWKP